MPQKGVNCAITNNQIQQSKTSFTNSLFYWIEREPFELISVKQLVLQSGYSRRTYYRYFGNKMSILDELLQNDLTRYVATLPTPCTSPTKIPEIVIEFLWSRRQRIQLLAQSDLLLPLVMKHIDFICDELLNVPVTWRSDPTKKEAYKYLLLYSLGGFCVLINAVFKENLPNSPQAISNVLVTALDEIIQKAYV